MCLYGSTYLFPLFLQQISRLIATESGLLMAPAGLLMAVLFPIAGRLADAFSHRWMILIGLSLFALSTYPMTQADSYTPVLEMLIWYCVGRAGLALVFPSLNAAAINPLSLDLIPHGAGAINFIRQLGGAFGINLILLTMQQRTVEHYDALNASQNWENTTTMELIRLTMEQLHYLGLIGYQGFEASLGFVVNVVGFQSMTLAYRDGFAFVGLVTVLSLLPGLFIAGRRRLVTVSA
jgi:MFS family permease